MNNVEICKELEANGYVVEHVTKTANGIPKTGISLHKEEEGKDIFTSPILYDENIEELTELLSTSDAAKQIIEWYEEAIKHAPVNHMDAGKIISKSYILSNIRIAVQREGDEEDLIKEACADYPGIEAYLHVVIDMPHLQQQGRYKLNRQILAKAEISEAEAWEAARENTSKDVKIIPLEEKLGVEKSNNSFGLYFASSSVGGHDLYGAAAMLYKEKIQEFGKICGVKKVAILPSSIHEVLLFPIFESLKSDFLNQMVKEVNSEQVDPTEQLADRAYFVEIA